jgi:hypothetical protein
MRSCSPVTVSPVLTSTPNKSNPPNPSFSPQRAPPFPPSPSPFAKCPDNQLSPVRFTYETSSTPLPMIPLERTVKTMLKSKRISTCLAKTASTVLKSPLNRFIHAFALICLRKNETSTFPTLSSMPTAASPPLCRRMITWKSTSKR